MNPEGVVVEYDPITGVPAEFNEFLPHDCPEYKKWKESLGEGEASGEASESRRGSENDGKEPAGSKGQKKKIQEIVLETSTRSKKKSITSIHGLELFDIKLSEAAKACGKKFASGASVNKTAAGKDQIDIQGDVSYELPDFLISLYGSKGLKKKHIFQIINKRKEPVYDSN